MNPNNLGFRQQIIFFILFSVFNSCQVEQEKINRQPYLEGPHFFLEDEGNFRRVYFMKKELGWDVNIQSLSGIDKITVETPFTKPFEVNIRDVSPPEADFPAAENILVISDVEGNFEALWLLLKQYGVIDQEFNWTFNSGHLVLLGDLFDRGQDVTPLLWLLYRLQADAKLSEGSVNILLGNHELMIFNDDQRYIHPKYAAQCASNSISYSSLYKSNTILGQWIRMQPAIIRIGDLLFSHAGISEKILKLNLDIQEMNQSIYQCNNSDDSLNQIQKTLIGNQGVFWYRGWVTQPIDQKVADQILERYSVRHMIIGHTIVDQASVRYNGKIIAVDFHQPESKSQIYRALLIENNSFYEVNHLGDRKRLKIPED